MLSPQLRKQNFIKTITGTLAIEDNTLGVEHISALGDTSLSSAQLMAKIGLKHKPTFRKNYLILALEQGVILTHRIALSRHTVNNNATQ